MTERRIVAIRLESPGTCVVELDCGHVRHVRDRPPLERAAWVRDAAERAARIGGAIECGLCGQACPCGSGRTLAGCCGPYHGGAEPPDAEALMRSRFAAYARQNWAYLWRTLHATHADRGTEDFAAWSARIAESSSALQFRKLLVIATAPPDRDGFAHVLFHADIRVGRDNGSFAEHSRFLHDGTGWRYVDGATLSDREVPRPLAALTFDSFAHACRR